MCAERNDGKVLMPVANINPTGQQMAAVRRLLGEKSYNDVADAIAKYKDDPASGDCLANAMFAYGVAYAAGRIYRQMYVDQAPKGGDSVERLISVSS